MGFRVFDVLFVVVLVLAAVAVVAAFYLVEPYPAVIAAAFAGGAAAFLYLTIRAKMGGIVEEVEQRLSEQEVEAARHREALEKSFGEIDHLTRTTREQITAAHEKSANDVDALRKNVNAVIDQFNRRLEQISAALAELKTSSEKRTGETDKRLATLARSRDETAELLRTLSDDFNSFVADERHFRAGIEKRLEEKVADLEDFIREKRKSLQI